MELQSYLSKFERPTRIFSPIQALATEIYEATGRRAKFPQLCGMISRKGIQFSNEKWQEIKKGDGDDKLKLFVWSLKNTKVEMKEITK